MKKVNIILVAILVLGSMFSFNSFAEGGIDFKRKDWDKVLQQAQKENKIIFVDVYADWCGPCRNLSSSTFVDEGVASYFNKNFINVKIDGDAESSSEFLSLYPIEAYPTLYFISPKGDVIKKAEGFQEAEDLILLGEIAINPEKSPFNMANQKLNAGNYSPSDLFEYVIAAIDEDLDYSSRAEEYLSYYQPQDLRMDSVFIVFVLSSSDVASPFCNYFSKNYHLFNELYGEYASEKFISLIEMQVLKLAQSNNKEGLKDVYAFINNAISGEDYEEFITEIDSYYNSLVAEDY